MFALKSRVTAIAGAAALIAGGIVGLTGTAAEAAAVTYTAAPAVGVGKALSTDYSATTNPYRTVALTGKGFRSAAGVPLYQAWAASVVSGIQVAASCGTTLGTISGNITNNNVTTENDGVISVITPSATRMVVTLGNTPLNAGAKKDYKICVYADAGDDTTTNVLLGSASFSANPAPTVTSANAVLLSGGDLQAPNYGGTTVALDGTNFTSKATVTVGGAAATNVKFIDATSLTFTLPPAPATGAIIDQNIVVTTEGGNSDATNTQLDYIASVKVSPTAVLPAGGVLTVTGKGFNSLLTPAVSGINIIEAGDVPTGTVGAGASVAEVPLTSITIVSDTEIVFTTPVLPIGAYSIRVCDTLAAACGATSTAVSSGAVFAAADF